MRAFSRAYALLRIFADLSYRDTHAAHTNTAPRAHSRCALSVPLRPSLLYLAPFGCDLVGARAVRVDRQEITPQGCELTLDELALLPVASDHELVARTRAQRASTI